MLTIAVPLTTRAEMNTSTPRFGTWTYHHVLPVRVYYLAASTILRVIIEPDCWKDTRTLGLLALRSMCQYRANEEKIALFLQNRKWLHTRPSHAEYAEMAKLCGSPPYGGFGGPNPAQRSDDPHEQEEPNRPISANPAWWVSLKFLRLTLYQAYGLQALPDVNTEVQASKELYAWCGEVLTIVKLLKAAESPSLPVFRAPDWACDDDNIWTVLPGNRITVPNTVAGQMKLRLHSERRTYIDTTDTPIAALVRRGARVVAQRDDYFYQAAPA